MNKIRLNKFLGFTALAIASFMGTLDSTIINIALPDIMSYFKAGLNDTSWISTIYVLGLSVFMIPASKLADQFGRKKVMLIGLVLFGGSSALCGLSQSLFFLIAMRLLQGVGGAVITPIVVPMALELFGKKSTQKVAGAVGAVTALAAAGGPPIGGLLIKYVNWQSIFYVNVPFSLISLLLALFFIKESYDKTAAKSIDWLGMLLLMPSLFLLTFSLLKGRDYGWGSVGIILMFIGSAVCLALFILAESRVRNPMVPLELFKESTFSASSACYLITGFGIVAPLLIFNYFLQNVLGYEALNAAYIIMAVSLTVIAAMPLGSMIAGKLGAKPVNFCGILFMGAAALWLAFLKADTSKFVMVANMVLFGFGLGFSCQSMVSSIKHLPPEKSGIGSGVVNAARQIGTCIGIALLVSILNSQVANAKIELKTQAASDINSSSIAAPVKSVMIEDINQSFGGESSSGDEQKLLREKLEKDVRKTLSSLSTAGKPAGNSTLSKLHDGAAALSEGAGKLTSGQKTLGSGIGSLSSGIQSLKNGGETLNNGLGSLDSGLSRILDGAQTLQSKSSEGIGALSSGIGQLNDGAQQLVSQFSPGQSSGTPTVYDGVTGVADGAETLSANLNSYVSAANNTYYLMIKSNPTSALLLAGYKSKLAKAQANYAAAKDDSHKKQYALQVQALSNLVALYTAGTDPFVTDEPQFEAKLQKLMTQTGNKNVVASGSQLAAGSGKLAKASQQVSNQFKTGGAYRTGVYRLANGLYQLNQSTGSLHTLQNATAELTGALSKVKNGSGKLIDGTRKLNDGLVSAQSGSERLQSGSIQLIEADNTIQKGADKLALGVSLAGQQSEIQQVLERLSTNKNEKIAGAFDQTFFISAVILILSSVFGLFTDKKRLVS